MWPQRKEDNIGHRRHQSDISRTSYGRSNWGHVDRVNRGVRGNDWGNWHSKQHRNQGNQNWQQSQGSQDWQQGQGGQHWQREERNSDRVKEERDVRKDKS